MGEITFNVQFMGVGHKTGHKAKIDASNKISSIKQLKSSLTPLIYVV